MNNMKESIKSLGETVRTYRESRGLSQVELAKLTGRNPSFISRLESGEYQFTSQDTLKRLARGLKIRPQILYDAALTSGSNVNLEILPRSPEEILYEISALMPIQVPICGTLPSESLPSKIKESGDYITILKDKLGTAKKNIYALRVIGEDFSDFNIHDGDLVVMEPYTDILNDKVYILRLNKQILARYIARENGKIKLISSDGNYQIVEPIEVKIFGHVILVGGWKKL